MIPLKSPKGAYKIRQVAEAYSSLAPIDIKKSTPKISSTGEKTPTTRANLTVITGSIKVSNNNSHHWCIGDECFGRVASMLPLFTYTSDWHSIKKLEDSRSIANKLAAEEQV